MLYEHDRNHVTSPMPDALSGLLARVFGAQNAESTTNDFLAAWRYLADVRQRRHWLACLCPREPVPVLMYPRLQRGRVSLVRHPGHQHREDCPFFRLRAVSLPRTVDTETFAIVRRAEDLVTDRLLIQRLARLVTTSLMRAGVCEVCASDLEWHRQGAAWRVRAADVPGQYQRLTDAAGGLPLKGDATWADWLARHPKALPRLRRAIAESDLGSLAHGLYFGLVDELGDERRCWTREGLAETPIWLETATPLVAAGGPYVGAALQSMNAKGQARGRLGWVQPVFSRGLLLPVGSDAERLVVQSLLEQLRYWHEKRGGKMVRLSRPIGVIGEADLVLAHVDVVVALLVDVGTSPGDRLAAEARAAVVRVTHPDWIVRVTSPTEIADFDVRRELTRLLKA